MIKEMRESNREGRAEIFGSKEEMKEFMSSGVTPTGVNGINISLYAIIASGLVSIYFYIYKGDSFNCLDEEEI